MSDVVIYFEGGGDVSSGRDALRIGLETFFGVMKERARRNNQRLRVVPCGGRDRAMRAFMNAERVNTSQLNILLVDSEDEVTAQTPGEHLRKRDNWRELPTEGDARYHLMARVMETWLVADPDALGEFYGKGFNGRKLPVRENLEEVTKTEINEALDTAVKDTKKKRYHKIKHGAELLKKIMPKKVMGRCSHCKRLFDYLDSQLPQ